MSIRAYLYDADGTDREVRLDADKFENIGERQLLWVDVEGGDEQAVRDLARIFRLHRDTVFSLLRPGRRARLDIYTECFHVNVAAITEVKERYATVPIDFVVGLNFLLTIHAAPVDFLQSFDQRLKGDSLLGQLDAPSFLAALLDWHITDYFRAIEKFEAEVDGLEQLALAARSSDNMLARLVAARQRVAQIRRALSPHREVYAALARPDFLVLASSESAEHFRALNDRLERAIDAVENARELVIGSFEIFSTQTTQKTNHTIKLLTLVSVLVLPATVLAGLMGMSFHTRLYATGDIGFWTVIAVILATDALILVVARRRKWI